MCEIENDYQFQFHAPKVIRHHAILYSRTQDV